MLNYYSFRSHEEYLAAVQLGAKVELEVTGEANILSPEMAERIVAQWREEGICDTGLRRIEGTYHRYETYRIV